jgi:hypothetical protein
MTFNSRLAQELGKWAEDQGRGDAFHNAVFLAYFQRGENIARKPVLLQICSSVGLDPLAAEEVLDQRSYREAVDEDWRRSQQMGITAVPTFVLDASGWWARPILRGIGGDGFIRRRFSGEDGHQSRSVGICLTVAIHDHLTAVLSMRTIIYAGLILVAMLDSPAWGDLTGRWSCNDGGTYYLRQTGSRCIGTGKLPM